MMPSSRARVPVHTSQRVSSRIAQQLEASLQRCAETPGEIDTRLRELDREWDIERAIEANASALAFGGIVLGATVDKRWLVLPAIVTGFLFQHAIQGWCPPIPILRRLGFRTAYEIEQERQALKALRGDFRVVSRRRSARRNGTGPAARQSRVKAAAEAVRA